MKQRPKIAEDLFQGKVPAYYNTVKKFSWIYELWIWADENNIDNPTGFSCRGIPRNKERLLDMTELDLSGYKLKDLPEGISYLENLESLDISDNMISELPYSLINLEKLSYLDYTKNRVTNYFKELYQKEYLIIDDTVSDDKKLLEEEF